MTDKERLSLSPWQKCTKYNRPPWKFICDVLVALLALTEVILISNESTEYDTDSRSTFKHLFLPDDCDDGVFTIDECVECIQQALQAYDDLEEAGVAYFAYDTVDGFNPPPVTVDVISRTQNIASVLAGRERLLTTETTKSYVLEVGSLGPFNATREELRQLFNSFVSVTLNFRIISVSYGDLGSIVYNWTVAVSYTDDCGGGKLTADLEASRQRVTNESEHTMAQLYALTCVVLALVITSALLHTKAVVRDFKVYWRIRRHQRQGHTVTWNDLPLTVKLRFFNLWFIITMLSCTFLAVASVLSLLSPTSTTAYNDTDRTMRVFLGAGTLLSLVNTMRYLGYYPKFYILILSLRRAAPRNFRFLCSVAPLFLGYAVCGVAFFSDYTERFKDIPSACTTLFALTNGDEIRATFIDVNESPYPWLGQLYVYTYVVIFITSVLNLFIFIIEDAYHIAKGIPDKHHSHPHPHPGHDVSVTGATQVEDAQVWDDLLRHAAEITTDQGNYPPMDPASSTSPADDTQGVSPIFDPVDVPLRTPSSPAVVDRAGDDDEEQAMGSGAGARRTQTALGRGAGARGTRATTGSDVTGGAGLRDLNGLDDDDEDANESSSLLRR